MTEYQLSAREEEFLREFWEKNIHNGFLYQGTNDYMLTGIKKYGLGLIKPFDTRHIERVGEIYKKAYSEERLVYEWTSEGMKSNVVCVTIYKEDAVRYAQRSPEVIRGEVIGLIDVCKNLIEDYKSGKLSRISPDEIKEIEMIMNIYKRLMEHNQPVVLWIKMNSPSILDQIDKEYAKMIRDLDYFKKKIVEVHLKYHKRSVDESVEIFFKDIFCPHFRICALRRVHPEDIVEYEFV